jgi:hypothetical protein
VPVGLGIFLFDTLSGPALGPTQPPIQWVPGSFSLGVKLPGREADHSPPSSWRGAQLKHRDKFTFYFYLGLFIVGPFYLTCCEQELGANVGPMPALGSELFLPAGGVSPPWSWV